MYVCARVSLTCMVYRYHEQSLPLVRNMLQPENTQFAPPLPDGVIINDGGNGLIPMEAGKTYRLRIICFSALAAAMIHFDSHPMTVIMMDADYVQPQKVDQLRVSAAQRYDVLISATERDERRKPHGRKPHHGIKRNDLNASLDTEPDDQDTSRGFGRQVRNFPYLVSLDVNQDYTANPLANTWALNFTGMLVLDPHQDMSRTDVVGVWQPADDARFLPLDRSPALPPPDKTWVLNMNFCFDPNGYPR